MASTSLAPVFSSNLSGSHIGFMFRIHPPSYRFLPPSLTATIWSVYHHIFPGLLQYSPNPPPCLQPPYLLHFNFNRAPRMILSKCKQNHVPFLLKVLHSMPCPFTQNKRQRLVDGLAALTGSL